MNAKRRVSRPGSARLAARIREAVDRGADRAESIHKKVAKLPLAPFEGVEGLRQALLSSELFLTTMTEKLLTYALGRGVEHYDMPAVRKIVRDAAEDDHRFSAVVFGVVESPAFRMRRAAEAEALAAL